ncbi:MAG TPA: ABC transporter ATP-binding protein [Draconibacterium sp.]|nr:ABC transporter ATP-binding protein [Draconibacterium sp.]
MNIIQTYDLTKTFGDTNAVDHISINVREGEIYGFLGLNGAGKTTLIRLLLGMINPDSGSVSLFGQNAKQGSDIWNEVGYLVETPYSYPNLTVKENLEVFYQLRGLNDRNQIDKIISVLQLDQYKNKKAKHLSLGNNQRLGLAKALLHNPKLLILDEPINGLDPAGIVEVREFLKDLVKNHNTTIFLSSHILSEISKVATRIGIVHEGKLIKEINTNELEDQIIKKLCINTNENQKALQILKDNGFKASINGNGLIESTESNAIQQPELISALLVKHNVPPKMISVFEEDLEAYFLRMIKS